MVCLRKITSAKKKSALAVEIDCEEELVTRLSVTKIRALIGPSLTMAPSWKP